MRQLAVVPTGQEAPSSLAALGTTREIVELCCFTYDIPFIAESFFKFSHSYFTVLYICIHSCILLYTLSTIHHGDDCACHLEPASSAALMSVWVLRRDWVLIFLLHSDAEITVWVFVFISLNRTALEKLWKRLISNFQSFAFMVWQFACTYFVLLVQFVQ